MSGIYPQLPRDTSEDQRDGMIVLGEDDGNSHLSVGGYTGTVFSDGNLAGSQNFKSSLSFKNKQLISRKHILETSKILAKMMVTRISPVAWFHIGVCVRYTCIIINPQLV